MTTNSYIALAFLTFALATPATARAERPRVAVFSLQDKTGKLSAQEQAQLTDFLRSKIADGGVFRVIAASRIKAKLAKLKKKSYDACYDEKCQIEIGRELAANKSLSFEVLRLGSRCMVISTLFDLRSSATDASASHGGGCTISNLVKSIETVTDKIKSQSRASTQFRASQANANVKRGGLFIKSKPSAAEVWIDGKKVKGKTPLAASKIPVGEHFIELRLGDYRHSGKVKVKAEQYSELNLELKKVKGALEIITRPPEALIKLNGKAKGKTPAIITNIATGNYEVVLEKAGHLTVKRQVALNIDQRRKTLVVDLKRAGSIALRSEPVGATVYVNGQLAGKAPGELQIAAGTYSLRWELASHVTATRQVTIKGGEFKAVKVALKSLSGRLRILTKPPGASIQIDGKHVGKTPIVVAEVALGKRTLTLRKAGHMVLTENVELKKPGEQKTLAFSLKRAGSITLRSVPKGAQVFVNDTLAGKSPGKLKIGEGSYTLRWVLAGFTPQTLKVSVKGGQNKVLKVKLVALDKND